MVAPWVKGASSVHAPALANGIGRRGNLEHSWTESGSFEHACMSDSAKSEESGQDEGSLKVRNGPHFGGASQLS